MAWEWVAPVATGVTGVVGATFVWYSGHQGRRHSELTAERSATNAMLQAREARRAVAYVEILTGVHKIVDVLKQLLNTTNVDDHATMREALFAHADERLAIAAKAGVYGTLPVRNLMAEWAKAAEAAQSSQREVSACWLAAEEPGPPLLQRRAEARQELAEITKRLRSAMNADLS